MSITKQALVSGEYAILGEQHDILVGGYTIVGPKGGEPDDGLAYFAYEEDAAAVIQMFSKFAELKAKNELLNEQYGQLIYSVAMKHPNESRHETALRYIRNAAQPRGPEMAMKVGVA